ncbi:MAG: response regulator, partial [Candidatus Xenobia bacterium]
FTAEDGPRALDAVVEVRPDLIVLDLAMPGMSGLEVCKRIREWSQVPIIVLTVRNTEKDKIAALDMGADDYVTKPFGLGELLARMRANMRRLPARKVPEQTSFSSGDLEIDFLHRRVTRVGQEVHLTPIEYDLFRQLVTNADRILTHRQLLTSVWGVDYAQEKPLLRVHIANLRQKIEPVPARPIYIISEPGVGYRFQTPEK